MARSKVAIEAYLFLFIALVVILILIHSSVLGDLLSKSLALSLVLGHGLVLSLGRVLGDGSAVVRHFCFGERYWEC